jgi:hypothetical protein
MEVVVEKRGGTGRKRMTGVVEDALCPLFLSPSFAIPHSVSFFFPPLSQSLTLCTDIGRHGIFCPLLLSHFIATA